LLPKRERLSRSSDIRETVRRKQYSNQTPLLYFAARDNSLSNSRLAVVTPRKLGKAVARNRLRRVFAAVYEKIKENILGNVDLVIFPRPPALRADFAKIVADLNLALLRARIVKHDQNS
jgi:ribonuclease P protein component